MFKLVLIAASGLVLSACVTTPQQGQGNQYWKPNTEQSQRQLDLNQCDYESSNATANITNPWDKPVQRRNLMHKCMVSKGYQLQG